MYSLITIILFVLFPKIYCVCVIDYGMVCDQISDLKNHKNSRITSMVIRNKNNIPKETLKVGTFTEYTNLEELTIMGAINNLETEAFRVLSKLIVLKLHKNSINTLTDFTFIVLPSLVKLDLQNNNIQYINSTGPFIYTNLKTVNLSFNKLKYLTWDAFGAPGLEKLLISNNEITEIGQHVFSKNLLLLNLDNNRLYNIEAEAFNSLERLEELVLSNNIISILLNTEKLRTQLLKKLDLSHNHIGKIDQGFFGKLPKLRHLYLNHNRIKQLPNDFSHMKLYTLHVHSNQLLNIETVYNNPNQYLQEMTVANNPFPCICMENIFLFMVLYQIKSTPCEDAYLQNESYPTCVGIDISWDHGKCTLSEPIDDYLYEYFNKNINPC